MSINSKTALHRRLLYFILLTWRPGVRATQNNTSEEKKLYLINIFVSYLLCYQAEPCSLLVYVCVYNISPKNAN